MVHKISLAASKLRRSMQLRWAWSLVFAVLACDPDPKPEAPPFVFQVVHNRGNQTVLDLRFETYEEALNTGPYVVTLAEDDVTLDLEVEIGLCLEVAPCAAPMDLETLYVTANPDIARGIVGYYCRGLSGSRLVGIDGTNTGACRRHF